MSLNRLDRDGQQRFASLYQAHRDRVPANEDLGPLVEAGVYAPDGDGYALTDGAAEDLRTAPLALRHPGLAGTYQELRAEHGAPEDVIVVGGRTKAGSSYLADVLGEELDRAVYHGSSFFRQMAREQYPDLDEESAVGRLEERIQQDRDGLAAELGTDPDVHVEELGYETMFAAEAPLIMESRLAPWYAPGDTALQLTVETPLEVAVDRLTASGDWTGDAADAEVHIVERRERLRDRYRDRYGVDIADDAVFDHGIDNSAPLDADRRAELVEQVRAWLG